MIRPIRFWFCLGLALSSLGAVRSETVLDVLILHTPDLVNYYDGRDGALAHIHASVASANMAFENSEVDIRLRLRKVAQIDYVENESDMSADLEFIATSSEVAQLRNEVGADLVSFFRWSEVGDTIGIALILRDRDGKDETAFSVVTAPVTLTNFVFQHEIGHNLGAVHDRDNSEKEGLYPYSYGHRFDGRRTVMAYAPGLLVNHFSNPNVRFDGALTGVASGDEAADNARTFNSISSRVNGYRNHIHKMPVAVAGGDIGDEDLDGDGVERITLDASRSDSETSIVSWEWTWSGGSASGETLSRDFSIGSTSVTLTITDDEGYTDEDTITVSVFEKSPIALAAGGHHNSFFLKGYGALWGVGRTVDGQLGYQSWDLRTRPVEIFSIGVKLVAAGLAHTLVLKEDGSVWVMGKNDEGQLGDGTFTNRYPPFQLFESGVAQVSAGFNHSLILKEDGSAWAMGENIVGQLGDGSSEYRNSPVEIFDAGIVAIAAGHSQSWFIDENGALWGTGKFDRDDWISTPRIFIDSGVVSVSAGNLHVLIVKEGGSLWTLGYNSWGQLGDGTQEDRDVPIRIIDSGVMAVGAGDDYSLVLMDDGSLLQMGLGPFGRNIYGSPVVQSTPIQVVPQGVSSIAVGSNHAIIIRDDGSAWTIGDNSQGQLGIGHTGRKDLLVKVFDSVYPRINEDPVAYAGADVRIPDGEGNGVEMVSLDASLSSDDWQLRSWEWSWDGGSVSGKIISADFPKGDTLVTLTVTDDDGGAHSDTVLITIAPQTNVAAIDMGNEHSLILKEDGSLWAAGSNRYGQIGSDISYSNSWRMIEASGVLEISATYDRSLYIKEDGSLWGLGSIGSWQDGATDYEFRSPVLLVESGVESVFAGYFSSFFTLKDGSLWATGSNTDGQLGIGSTEDVKSPVEVMDGGIEKVVSGWRYTLFLKTNGSLWASGRHELSAFGVQSTVPVELVASGVVDVGMYADGIQYLLEDGSLYGLGDQGQLSSYQNLEEPLKLLSGVTRIESYRNSLYAFMSDGSALGVADSPGSGPGFGENGFVQVLGSGIREIATGGYSSLFLRSDGSLWGAGGSGVWISPSKFSIQRVPVPIRPPLRLRVQMLRLEMLTEWVGRL